MAEPLRPSFRLRPNEHRLILLLGDLAASTLAVFLAAYVWRQFALQNIISKGIPVERAERILRIQGFQIPSWFYVLPLVWLLLMVELYDARSSVSWRRTVRGIARAAFIGAVAYALIFIFNQDPTSSLPRIGIGAFIALASLFTLILRLSYIRLYTSSGLQRRVVIVGAGKAGMTLAKVYCEANPPPFSLIGFIDDDFQKTDKLYYGYPVIGGSKNLLAIVDQYRVSDVVVAITGDIQGSTFQTILDVQERGVEVSRMPILYEEITQRLPVHHLESDWLIRSFVDQLRVSMFYEFVKRLLDIIGGILGLVVFALLFPFIAIAIAVDSGFPVLYSQDRLGKGGEPFKIFKYRTMVKDAEPDGLPQQAAVNDDRVTRVGNILRITHLDELPQFWNVLRGDMSLVGPRAERAQLIAEYQKQIPFYRARLLVKPGLTGWAQINYGYVASVTETGVKLEYDLYYIKHRSLMLDVTIILRTIGTVISRKGR
jgi:exopolysaccharide biosynthesis polyprenyl glycosylphosphotransferase